MPDFLSIEERFLQELEKVIEANHGNESFGVSQLAGALGMSRSTLHRKLKGSFQKSANAVLKEFRLKRAMKLLQHNTGTVSEIAYQVGFGSVSHFISSFHSHFGSSPGEVLRGNLKLSESETPEEKSSPLARSIALLPLINDGPDINDNFFVEGLREELISRLSMIGDMEVISRTTSDTFKNSGKTLKEIGKELNVNYILEGSYQRYQQKTRVRLQLIEAKTDYHLWSQPYECLLGDNNLFEFQQELAFKVADDLQSHLTPEETQSLKKMGTKHTAAYQHYQNGLGYQLLAKNGSKFSNYWKQSLGEFNKAVDLDPRFAESWLKLAETTVYYYIWPNRYLTGFMDLHLYQDRLAGAEKAMSLAHSMGIDTDELALFMDALNTISMEEMEQKTNAFLTAHENSESKEIYLRIGNLFFYRCDYYNAFKFWLKYLGFIHKRDIPTVYDLHFMVTTLGLAGCEQYAISLADKSLQQTQDKLGYKYMLMAIKTGKGADEFVRAVQESHNELPEDLVFTNMIMLVHILGRNYPTALKYLYKLRDLLQESNRQIYPSMFIAYLHHAQGMQEDMEWHCQKILENKLALTEKVVVPFATFQFTELAGIYALMGQKEEMYACLNQIVRHKSVLMDILVHLKHAPNFDPYQQEPEFLTIISKLESKFELENERIQSLFH